MAGGDDALGALPLASLLRIAYGIVRQNSMSSLAAGGFDELSESHLTVLFALSSGPERPIELARRCRMSRQALDYLLRSMETMGYVRRVRRPSESRRPVVELTKKGSRANKLGIAAYEGLETAWRELSGTEALENLRQTLVQLVNELG